MNPNSSAPQRKPWTAPAITVVPMRSAENSSSPGLVDLVMQNGITVGLFAS